MAYIAYSRSPIHVRETGGAVDPGYGQGGNRPDNSLPGNQPGIDNELPPPPPGVWPPPVASHPIVPAPPGTPPGTIWPSPGRPDNSLPGEQPGIDNALPSSTFWVVAGIPGYGWRYICVDPSLQPSNELPGGRPNRPDNTLPETPSPKS